MTLDPAILAILGPVGLAVLAALAWLARTLSRRPARPVDVAPVARQHAEAERVAVERIEEAHRGAVEEIEGRRTLPPAERRARTSGQWR